MEDFVEGISQGRGRAQFGVRYDRHRRDHIRLIDCTSHFVYYFVFQPNIQYEFVVRMFFSSGLYDIRSMT